MFRYAGILLAAAMLLHSTATAQQQPAAKSTVHNRNVPGQVFRDRDPRRLEEWRQPQPEIVVPPILGLLMGMSALITPQRPLQAPPPGPHQGGYPQAPQGGVH